jgi:hypothetical protein
LKGKLFLRTILSSFFFLASFVPAFGQSTPPFLNILDFASDSAASPLLLLQGGQTASTLGVEVTTQSTGSTTSNLPNLGSIMGIGFGGLSLVQTSPAVNGAGQNSPFFCTSGNQWNTAGTPATVAAVWCLHVHGGNAITGGTGGSPDVIEWTRPTGTGYGNPTGDLTMLWPNAINLASNGQLTVGPNVDTFVGNVAGVPSTFTGQKTSVSSGTVAAGPITIEPGQLIASSVPAGSTEGPLQILQGYIAGSSTSVGRLACPSTGSAQTVTVCTTTGAAENWVGVFNSIAGAQGVTVTPLRYGRVGISSNASGLVFDSGEFVCKDDVNAGFVIDNGSTPCLIGESVGIAVGDPSTPLPNNEHLVDLVAEAGVSGAAAQGQILHFTCIGAVSSSSTIYLNGGPCSTTSTSDAVEFTLPYAIGTYQFSRMYVNYTTAGVSTDTVTLYVNGTATLISCSPTSASTCSDLADSASILAGQNYSIRVLTHASDSLKNIDVTIQLK